MRLLNRFFLAGSTYCIEGRVTVWGEGNYIEEWEGDILLFNGHTRRFLHCKLDAKSWAAHGTRDANQVMIFTGDDGWEGGSVGSDYNTLRKSRAARPTMVLGAARLCFKWTYTPARLSAALGLALLAITSLWLALAQEKRRAACWQGSIPAFVGTLRPPP
jgi:hypothetical protein